MIKYVKKIYFWCCVLVSSKEINTEKNILMLIIFHHMRNTEKNGKINSAEENLEHLFDV